MNFKQTLLATVLAGVAVGGYYLFDATSQPQSEANMISNDRPMGGDFTLNSVNGPVNLSDFKGKLTLVYFGYTYCPDICPTNLGNLSVAYRGLTQQQKDNLQILFVSVDPERDTPERLKQYADYFESGIIGVTGSAQTVAEISQRYGVVYARVDDPNNGTNYAVDHSAFTYVVDQNGVLQEQLPHATSPENFIEVIKRYQDKG
ncbi:SCO family protein [Thiomicrorhabdus indica]|uniref:SCO family protein n=1 Tax=Thiomicrorhabdus indica TaxID=2267253 RepID=UPI002AA8C98D|nr:SCO family protein [Thiomicrorhabdus indica]